MRTEINPGTTRLSSTGLSPATVEPRGAKLLTIRSVRSALTLLVLASQPLLAATQPKLSPDLTVKEFQFPPTSQQSVRVHVANQGESPATPCKLRLTVRKIGGNPVGRTTEIKLPAITPDKGKWMLIDASNILPQDVALKDTVFRLNVDPDNAVSETNETNNEVWHGLYAQAAPTAVEPADTQQLSAEPQQEQKLSCKTVSGRWQVCGSVSRTRFVAGIGIRFNRIDPNGRIVSSRSYEDCSKLAADRSIPAHIREKAAEPCRQSLQLAGRAAAVR